MNRIKRIILLLGLILFVLPFQKVYAETLEDQLNNLIGPKQQYNTMLSPVYLKTNYTEEYISPQSGGLTITQTDYVLPGRNGLDLEFTRIYKSGISNVQEMKVKYVNGAWVDYVQSDSSTSSFFEDRYNLGIGTRFSFPSIEVKKNSDGTSHKFLHTESGDVYRLKPFTVDGSLTYFVEGQTIKDVSVKETSEYSNGQSDGTSKYVMIEKDGKRTYFTEDGRILGIVDRYGNTIKFEYTSLSYTIDGKTNTKKLISKITDTVGRVVTVEYKEDQNFTVSPITNEAFSAEESYKASQNPNNTDSGDLKGKFQVILHLPDEKTIVYDKSAVLVSSSKHVIRTRLQRVYDVDGKPKYHFWYEQPDLGFTFSNGTSYSVYNRYENLTQIDYVKTNQIKRYEYNTYTKDLNDGSMQYRKIFAKKDLVKKDYDPAQTKFLNRFITEVKDKVNYAYTNEPDGFGFSGYQQYNDYYLRNTYRYETKETDIKGNTTTYTYDGINQLLTTVLQGNDHKEVTSTERDEMKLVKKKEILSYPVKNGQIIGEPVKKVENYRYDEYGNLTNYTGPEAKRDANGYPIDTEHTVIYSYAYDKYHVPTLKTWKKDKDTTSQIIYTVDDKGNVIKETKVNTDDKDNWLVIDYLYDTYGNMTRKVSQADGQSFVTNYEYGTDINGINHKGAYLTKEYSILNGQEMAVKYAYDLNTGNLTAEVDQKGNKTSFQYDDVNRVIKVTNPDNSTKEYVYDEKPYANFKIKYTDPEKISYLYEYDILGSLVKASVYENNNWNVLITVDYDAKGNKTKELDANGHSIRYEYDSKYRLIKKSYFENDTVNKGDLTVDYTVGYDINTPLLVTITDEEGYSKKFYYDHSNHLIKREETVNKVNYHTVTYTYDYEGNKLTETDATNHTTQFIYDNLGRLIKTIDALGNETSLTYNALNQVRAEKEPGDKFTEYIYDALGRVSVKKIYQQGSNDYLYTNYSYDQTGNVINVQQGMVKDGIDQLSSDISYAYDVMNNQTDEYVKIDNIRTGHTHYTYDHNGNKMQVVKYVNQEQTKFRIYTFAYNYAGKVNEESGTYKDGYTEYGKYHKKYEWDYAGNLIKKSILNTGNNYDITTYTYNYRNKLKEKLEPFTSNQDTKKTSYQYDKVGNLITQSQSIQGVESTTFYQYDGLGRIIKKIDSLGNTARYLYDANGNLIKEIDPRYLHLSAEAAPGIEYQYDELNRRIKTIVFDGRTREVISYKEFDGRGNLVKEVDGEGYNTTNPSESIGNVYEYNVYDNLTTYYSAQTFAVNKHNGTEHYTTKFTYDSSGNILTEQDALGNSTTYVYYLNGQLKEKIWPDGIKESYDYDLTGKVTAIKTDRAGNIIKTYNNIFNKPYRVQYPDGTSESFNYSPKGNLTEHIDQAGNHQYYSYDPSGNMTTKQEWIKADADYTYYKLVKNNYDEANRLIDMETFNHKQPNRSGLEQATVTAGDKVDYIYDKLGRLIRVVGPYDRETINEYDKASNMITKKQKISDGEYDVKRYSYDVRSQLISESVLVKTSDLEIEYLSGAKYDSTYYDRVLATTSYSYNLNGQINSKKDPQGNITTYEYDYDKRLVKKVDPLQETTIYRYDLKGNLVEEINAKEVSTYYEYDNLNRLIRKKTPAADGTLAVTRYIYDVMGNLIKQVQPNQYEDEKDTQELADTMLGIAYSYDKMNRRIATISPDGQIIEYVKYNALGQVVKVADGLRYDGDMNTAMGTIYKYDGLGRVIQVTNALGQSTYYQYDILGSPNKLTDARNNTTTYTYNPDQTLAKITYPDDGTISYTYDKLGRKTSQTDQRGNTVAFTYNALGKQKEMKDPYNQSIIMKYDLNGNLVSQKDKKGNITLFRYDANNRLTTKKTPLELDGSGNIVYATETYTYDPVGNILRQSIISSKDKAFIREVNYTYYNNDLVHTVSDNSGSYISYGYDRNGNEIKIERLREANLYDIEKMEYDNQNRIVKYIRFVDQEDIYDSASNTNLVDPEYPDKIQSTITYQYDILGNKIAEIDPRGYTIHYTYDLLNRLDKIIRQHNGNEAFRQFTYDAVGNQTTVRNERGYLTQYTYDSLNRLITTIDTNQNIITNNYDPAGNQIAVTNAKGDTITYSYDKLNRVITITDAYNTVISKNIYDANGNIIKQIDAKGYLSGSTDEARYGTLYTYDLANRLVKITDPEIAVLKDVTKFSKKYDYNPVGQKIKETDALGNTIIYIYDNAGRLTNVTDQKGISTTYAYDNLGNKLYMVDGKGKITKYSYGAFGLLKEVMNADNLSMKYQYDLAGNLTLQTDRKGNHIEYTYDYRNLLLSKSVVETSDSISYTYDEVGNRITMIDESGTSNYNYDGENQLLQIKKDGIAHITYTYDTIGNIETVTDKKGNTTSYTYDKSNRMKTVSFNSKTTTYDYDENGNRKTVIYQGGVKEEYTYDKNNNSLSLLNKKPNGSNISSYSYTYDLAGRQSSKTDSFGTTSYTYDPAGRIKAIEAPGKTTIYTYDNAGNRQTLVETYTSNQPSGYIYQNTKLPVEYTIKKSEYIYSNTNQLLKLVEKMYDQEGTELIEKTTTYLYDNNGNEISQKVGYILPHNISMRQVTTGNPYGNNVTEDINSLVEKVSNTYDGFNRLKKVDRIKNGERASVEYTYNGDDLRTKKLTKSSKEGYLVKTTNYLYDRQHVILETDAQDNITARYIKGINYIARISGSNQLSYYLYNGHGDVVQTVTETGEIENQYDYDIFGNPILTLEVYSNSIRYAGEFYDQETGLYYLRARYYNPYTGRFFSEDSYWGEESNPLSLNLYTYVYNDPIQYIDPTGHWGGKDGEEDDSQLSPEDQRKIKALTDAWFSADTQEERDRIHEEAQDIRDEAKAKGNTSDDYSDSFADDANEHIKDKGNFTKESWQKLSAQHNRRSGGKYTQTNIQIILTHAEENFDYMMGSKEWGEEVDNTNKYYENRRKDLLGYDNLNRSIFGSMTIQERLLIQEEGGEDYDILTNSPEKLTLDMIMLDTENNPNELGRIKQNFVNSLYNEKTYFGRYYTTINDLVGELDPDKEFDQDLHYFRNTINEDIAPKTLNELYAINEQLRDLNRTEWVLLSPGKAAFHMNGENGVYNVKFVLGDGQNFEVVYNSQDGKMVTDAINMGTYNYIGPDNALGHYSIDVDPYYEWGNTKQIGGKGFEKENALAAINKSKFDNNKEAIKNYEDILLKSNPKLYDEYIKDKEQMEEIQYQRR